MNENAEAARESLMDMFVREIAEAFESVMNTGWCYAIRDLESFDLIEDDPSPLFEVLEKVYDCRPNRTKPDLCRKVGDDPDMDENDKTNLALFSTNVAGIFVGRYIYNDGYVLWTIQKANGDY